MSLYKTFKMNAVKENDGIDIKYDPNDDGSLPTFRVARQSKTNKKFQRVMKEISAPYQRQMDLGTLSEEVGTVLLRTAFIQGCLRGWENVQDESGENVPFTEENATKLFTDLPELLEDLQAQSNKLANYRAADLEEDAKN